VIAKLSSENNETPRSGSDSRPGFTLIELLVVIVILALLVGLLVPAVMRAVGTAKEAAVAAEIQGMSQALAAFKSGKGSYPPSSILVSENGDYSSETITDPKLQALGQRTLTIFRKLWPRMQFNTSTAKGPAPGLSNAPPGSFYDVNGNGSMDGIYVLQGPECLVLFLGGVPEKTSGGAGWATTGFSKNPSNPFLSTALNPSATNRTDPFFEFGNGRLVSNTENPTTKGYPFPGYVDSLGAPSEPTVIPFYCYFSAYEGVGYDPSDCDLNEPDSADPTIAIRGAFTSNNAPAAVHPNTTNPALLWSPAPNPYVNDVPVSTVANTGEPNPSTLKTRAWHNPNSFQIISPGRDRLYGIGGQYIPQGSTRLPFVQASAGYLSDSLQTIQANVAITSVPVASDIRSREGDNITNFSAGRLD
jgi:prepilin-type N-terminal cleavage/methylation domain-containing protein